jgi:hypothetical protein
MAIVSYRMHRGRIQSQGGGLNDSKPWSQQAPLDHPAGISLSHALESMTGKREKALRKLAHEKARAFMDAAKLNGGIGVTSKTYMVKGDPHRRVDIEVRNGLAFI